MTIFLPILYATGVFISLVCVFDNGNPVVKAVFAFLALMNSVFLVEAILKIKGIL